MTKVMKNLFLISIIILLVFMVGCRKKHTCQAGDWIYPEKYSCEDNFTIYKKCTICDKVLEEKQNNLSHNIVVETINATCDKEGTITKSCTNCDYVKVENLDKIDHDFTISTIDATCTKEGTITKTCTNCDYVKVETTPKIEHEITVTRVEATCVQVGYIEEKCINCDYAQKEVLTGGDHDLEITDIPAKCNYMGVYEEKCKNCDYYVKETFPAPGHVYEAVDVEPTCTEDGYHEETCSVCGHTWRNKKAATGHLNVEYVIEREATDELYGIKHRECKDCFMRIETVQFANNGYSRHGKLSVDGTDLINQYGEKVQLIGISTHGLQWAGQYVNYDTFEALRNTFGLNVIRLSLYTDEDGYCDGGATKKEKLYQIVVNGIKYATQLDMYVVLDWHMLGSDLHEEEAIEFFIRITEEFPDNQNLLFEIMNEPYTTELKTMTWAECKVYAERIIPIIRERNDGVVLIGSPRYSTDLESIQANPIKNIANIMYTYHFYAADHTETSKVINAFAAGLPIFISEHGGMEATGDGDIDYTSIANWYKVLNDRNISYIAWNLSNTRGSASMLKYGETTYTVFNTKTMKAWGVYYRAKLRERFGLPGLTE